MSLFHSHKLRIGRYSANNQIYLVTTVTAGRLPIFQDFTAGRILIKHMQKLDKQQLDSLAFVVMPDHLHWLFQLKNASLDQVMKTVKGCTAREVNAQTSRTGRLWQPGYHEHALRREEDMVAIARYIVANPIRAGLVSKVGDYPLWDAVWL